MPKANRNTENICVPSTSEKSKPHLSVLSKFLTVWIFLAMAFGITIGYIYPKVSSDIGALSIGTTSIPIAIGLILMMYPPLAKVRYEDLRKVFTSKGSKTMLAESLALNWVVGPLLMFVLAWVFLGAYPDLRNGIILIGIARCIAMVIVWNNLAEGDNELTAILVAINSIFQIVMYSVLAYFYITIASSWISGSGQIVNISLAQVAQSVAIYLGIPFFAGIITRYYFLKTKGKEWYEHKLMHKLSNMSLIALLFTIIVMFSLKRAVYRKFAVGCYPSCHPITSLFCTNVCCNIRCRLLFKTGLQKNNFAILYCG